MSTEEEDDNKPKLQTINYRISDDKVLTAIYEHFNISIDKDSGLVIFKPKYNLTPDKKIDRMAEVLFMAIKDNIGKLEIYSSADNSDMLGIDEFDIYKQIVIKMLRYWKA